MSTIAAAADRYLDCLHGLARTLTAQASENMVRALVAERDAVVKRAEKAEAEVARLRAQADPVAWLCEDQTFKGEYHFERKAERAAFFESEGDWAVTPLYASVTARPETKVRADVATARAALAEIAKISAIPIRRIAQDALDKMGGE
ncbi:hypothetical protein [Sinirhodobacter huangdaonensis]|uniref:Uncharacterized protein n=1 Tax=Paenirhodobacter huangdaonensis TaxID=2501515 RepID=A0A443M066_9RHOB|nr:hypothetical protein [Sinirhodobacter huangdaonensis]RWR54910.1 hypothetical protein EOW66_02275 [Sinirhodobacter huangdaonensis]